MIRVAFDFDGVIADTTSKKINWLKENKNISLNRVDKTNFYKLLSSFYSNYEIDELYKCMSKSIFIEDVLLSTEEVTNALNSLKKISNMYEIYIVSSRTPNMLKSVKKWLKLNDADKYIKKIISSSNRSKQDICVMNNIDFLCDDDVRHLLDEKIKNRLLFSSDKYQGNSSIMLVSSWDEIVDALDKIYMKGF